MSGVYPLQRLVIQALFLLSLLFICSAELHAAWNWTFPFYHDQPQPAVLPKAQETKEDRVVTAPEILQEKVTTKENNEQSQGPDADSVPLKTAPFLEPAVSAPAKPLISSTPTSRDTVSFDPVAKYSGEIFQEDLLWQGTVLIDGWVTVAPQATLTIGPGTIVRIAGNGGIHVLGRIIAKGSADSPILFASLYPEPLAGDWAGIVLSGTEKRNTFEHVRIEGADTGLFARLSSFSAKGFNIHHVTTAVKLQESVAEFSDGRISAASAGFSAANSEADLDTVLFEENRNAVSLTASSMSGRDVTIAANRFSGMAAEQSHLKLERFLLIGNNVGARFSGSDGSITDSVIRNNGETGIIMSGSRLKLTGNTVTGNGTGVQSDDNLPVLWGNSIHSNRSYNILYLGDETFFVGGNWFGPNGATTLERTIFSKRAGAVHTEPLLKNTPVSKE